MYMHTSSLHVAVARAFNAERVIIGKKKKIFNGVLIMAFRFLLHQRQRHTKDSNSCKQTYFFGSIVQVQILIATFMASITTTGTSLASWVWQYCI